MNCSKCDKTYESRGVLYKHFRDKHQGLFQYNCQSCDYGNDDRARFAHHMFKKHGVEIEGIVKCPNENCNCVAPQKCILLTYLDTCGEAKQNKKYKCDECEKGYRSRKSLNLYKFADHPVEGADVKQFPCDYPGCEKNLQKPGCTQKSQKTERSYCSLGLRLLYGIFICMVILHSRSSFITIYALISRCSYC